MQAKVLFLTTALLATAMASKDYEQNTYCGECYEVGKKDILYFTQGWTQVEAHCYATCSADQVAAKAQVCCDPNDIPAKDRPNSDGYPTDDGEPHYDDN